MKNENRSEAPGLGPITDPGGVPLYRQVKRALIKVIESRHYAPGDSLPSESDFADSLRVSIGTLRKAVDELVHENLLIRRQVRGSDTTLFGPLPLLQQNHPTP